MILTSKHFLILLIISAALIPIVSATDNTAVITMTGHRVSYPIDYGRYVQNVSLYEYKIQTSSTLDAVQTWEILGSENGVNWTVIDSQVNISFNAGVSQTFTISTPIDNQYYTFKIKNGFYDVGGQIQITLSTNSNPDTPVYNYTGGAHAVVDNDYYIAMTNTRVLYQIDYGTDASNITLLQYKAFADDTLASVQSWDIYGSNDNTGWSLIDSRDNIAVSIDSSQNFYVSTPKPYQYYLIYLTNGYYNIGKTAVFIFTTDQNGNGNITPQTPTPTLTPTPYPSQIEGPQESRVDAEIGETYIKWTWYYDNLPENTPVNIYTNDTEIPEQTGYIGNSYLITGLNAGEKHVIAIYTTNGTQLIGRATATTTIQSEYIYIMLGFCFIVMIVSLFLREWKFIIAAIFDIVICIFGAIMASGHGLLPYMFFGIAILMGIILLILGIPILRKEIDWT